MTQKTNSPLTAKTPAAKATPAIAIKKSPVRKPRVAAKSAKPAASTPTKRIPATKPKVAPKVALATSAVTVKKSPVTKPRATTNAPKVIANAPAKKISAVKASVVAKTIPVIEVEKAHKGDKKKRQKMVRDGFTMPESDYAYISALKKRCLNAGTSAKKSEVLRAALKCLSTLSDAALTKAIAELEPIKTGRPSKR